jgi:spore germination cell wall hydrolase CwlJ-like protein
MNLSKTRNAIQGFFCVVVFIALLGLADKVEATPLDTEQHCLAANIYFEAGNQKSPGKFAVGLVTRNRVIDTRWKANNICDVIKQRSLVKGQWICQFSWFCDGLADVVPNTPEEQEAYNESYFVAAVIIDNWHNIYDFTEGANHYHHVTVDPWWVPAMTLLVQIQDHIFYKWV